MKTVTEIITKSSPSSAKKKSGMISLFNPETEEIKDFWPIDSKEALANGWIVKPEKAFLVEPAPVIVLPSVPEVPPTAPGESDEQVYANRKAKRGVQSTESSSDSK